MAQGISVLLPLIYSKQDGPFELNKEVKDTVKQNFKNLILTNKGERLMDPLFGVGIEQYLFENYYESINFLIKSEIITQTQKYMPFITIQDLIIKDKATNLNEFYIYIKYSVSSLKILDELSFVIAK